MSFQEIRKIQEKLEMFPKFGKLTESNMFRRLRIQILEKNKLNGKKDTLKTARKQWEKHWKFMAPTRMVLSRARGGAP